VLKRETLELVRTYYKIGNDGVRQKIRVMVKGLASKGKGAYLDVILAGVNKYDADDIAKAIERRPVATNLMANRLRDQ
jgi:hypothetical protein